MHLRQDALVAASQVVLAVNRWANTPGQQVATVGQTQVSPNAANVIPASLEMSLDIRNLSNQRIDDLIEQLQGEMEAIATDTHTTIEMQPRLRNEPL